ncbi:MAG: AAA family ATPase, partial [Elusimicrobia bacterium]|nr:AAA family ATPase [Elusimicrobiota bacterium]
MYLKKVELFGFKSFAEKTVLNFEPGIGSIIGPNGCGKSNISDAIRWCMGETRAKTMRSSQMQDVIFGGTQTRSATGMSEVSLTFDNSQNVLPIDYSEVTVTRRLFRSGESEYYLNKTQCRLKDVRDLFLDTGLGRTGYSVIEQGRVDFLTTAEPKDRRELFEEAAGIAKYKVRREETLKRLEKIDSDMARLSDALVIHKEQITQLDVAAKKAKQYKKYQEDLAKYEVADLVQKIAYGNAEIERLKQTLEPKIVEYETSNTQSSQTDAQIQELRFTLETRNEEHVEFNRLLSEIKAEIAISDQIIQHATNREAELKAETENLKIEIEQNNQKSAQYTAQISAMTGDDTQLKEEVAALEAEYKNKESAYNLIKERLSSVTSKETELRVALNLLESEKEAIVNSRASLTETKIHLEAELASIERMVHRVETEIEPSRNEISALETELAQTQASLSDVIAAQEKTAESTAESDAKLKEIDDKLGHLRENLASTLAKVETLEEQNQKDPLHEALSALKVINGIKGTLSSLISIDEHKADIIISALGEKLNYVFCETQVQAEEAVKFLEDNSYPRVTFIVNEKLSGYQVKPLGDLGFGTASELSKHLKFAPEYEKAVNFICAQSIVSGNKVYSDVLVHGGAKTPSDNPLIIEEQIKKLDSQSGDLKKQIAALSDEASVINESKINVNLEKSRLSNEVIKLTASLETKKSLIEEKQRDIESALSEIQ